MIITLRHVGRVRRDPNSSQTARASSDTIYCDEVEHVHPYNVVDRLLISMFRDTTRHRYMRVLKNSLRVVHILV